jgi:tRNA-Thr(GGU) m(6)t(6)A37 methyltransferase TsaA
MNGADNMPTEFTFQSIAFFTCSKTQTLEAGSQGALEPDSKGYIELKQLPEWEAMIADLGSFSHLWIIFVFHRHAGSWKAKVLPPRSDRKVGVFASRSPYRPAPIGISAVAIDKIEGSRIYVSGHDLIDGTPILDLKPYLAYADSFPQASSGWLQETKEFRVSFTDSAQAQIAFLQESGISEIGAALQQQLRFHPTDKKRKRVKALDRENPKAFVFSYRTWRISFEVNDFEVRVYSVDSGYSAEDLKNPEDPYSDKALHRAFRQRYPGRQG